MQDSTQALAGDLKNTLTEEFLYERVSYSDPISKEDRVADNIFITRVNPITDSVARISKTRADNVRGSNLGVDADVDIKPISYCPFCHYMEETPEDLNMGMFGSRGFRAANGREGRFHHDRGAVSFRNLYPWERSQWVTAYPPFDPENHGHKKMLSEIMFDDVMEMMDSEFDIAEWMDVLRRSEPEIVGMKDFTNWGPYAGGSQQHPHSQRSTTSHELGHYEKNMHDKCRRWASELDANPFDVFMDEERKIGDRVIYDGDVFISAAYAPVVNDEIWVISKDDMTHILQTGQKDRERISKPILGLFPALYFYRGITDLNIAVYMSPFEEMDDSADHFRWHMRIMPRKSILPVSQAGVEMGYGESVIGVYPSYTAEAMRQWYRSGGPNEELVPASKTGQFKAHMNGLYGPGEITGE